MKKTVSYTVEKDLLESFDNLCDNLGTNRTNLLNMLMTQAVNSHKLEFYVEEGDVVEGERLIA